MQGTNYVVRLTESNYNTMLVLENLKVLFDDEILFEMEKGSITRLFYTYLHIFLLAAKIWGNKLKIKPFFVIFAVQNLVSFEHRYDG